MTKTEYNTRLRTLQASLASDCRQEEDRHNKAIGDIRSQFRKDIMALQKKFTETADESVLKDKSTILAPVQF